MPKDLPAVTELTHQLALRFGIVIGTSSVPKEMPAATLLLHQFAIRFGSGLRMSDDLAGRCRAVIQLPLRPHLSTLSSHHKLTGDYPSCWQQPSSVPLHAGGFGSWPWSAGDAQRGPKRS